MTDVRCLMLRLVLNKQVPANAVRCSSSVEEIFTTQTDRKCGETDDVGVEMHELESNTGKSESRGLRWSQTDRSEDASGVAAESMQLHRFSRPTWRPSARATSVQRNTSSKRLV